MDGQDRWSRRRFLASTGAIGATVLGISACGHDAAPSILTPSVPGDLVAAARPYRGTSLTMLSQQEYAQSANQALDRALQTFASTTHTTIKNSLFQSDAGNAIAKTDAAVKAGNAPDLAFFTAGRFIAQLQQLGDLVDVSDVVDRLQKKYGPAPGTAKTNLQIGGKWWGIPYYTIGGGWYARKDWLAEKGIRADELKTYADIRDAALEVSDPQNHRYGWGLTVNRSGDGDAFIENVINVYGGSMTADDGRTVVFDSPETVEAVSFITDLFTNPKYAKMLPPGIQSWTDSGNNEAWLAGVIGFTRNQFSLYADSKSSKNPVYAQTLTFSGVGGPATSTPLDTPDCQALVVFKGVRNPGLAKLVAQYLVAGTPLLDMAKVSSGLVLPAYEQIWNSDPFYRGGDPAFRSVHEQLTEALPIRTSTGLHFPQPPGAGSQAVRQSYVLTDMMGEILQNKTPVKKAVSDANQRILAIFRQAGIA